MRFLFVIVLLIGSYFSVLAQESDSLVRSVIDTAMVSEKIKILNDTTATKKETRAERKERQRAEKEREKYYYKGILKDSTRLELERVSRQAWRRSIFIPGWGQYTNGGLWWIKVPVIYGGFVAGALVFDYWQYYYREYLAELQFRYNTGGNETSDGPLGNPAISEVYLISRKDESKKFRDLTVLVMLGWYGLNIVEAYTDSMLKNRWSISDELTMHVYPTVIQNNAFNTGNIGSFTNGSPLFVPGVKLTFNFK